MNNKCFHLLCEKCEERSKRFPSSSLSFLSKHMDKDCPSDGLKVVFESGKRFKMYYGTVDYEEARALELKDCLSKTRRVLKDFVNMPDWKYGKDVDKIIEETINLRDRIVEDLEYEKAANKVALSL